MATKFRIKTYNESTLPIIEHFDKQKMVKRIDAGKSEEEVNFQKFTPNIRINFRILICLFNLGLQTS